MHIKSMAFLCMTILLLCGCANNGPLTLQNAGQFSVYPLNKQIYRISYIANDNIPFSEAQNIALVKAAQTTILNGYQYFTIQRGPTNVYKQPQQVVAYSGGSWGNPGYPWGPMWGGPAWDNPFYGMPEVVTENPAEIAYNIECYKSDTEHSSKAYDASLILQSLGQRYGVSSSGQMLPPPTPTAQVKNN